MQTFKTINKQMCLKSNELRNKKGPEIKSKFLANEKKKTRKNLRIYHYILLTHLYCIRNCK